MNGVKGTGIFLRAAVRARRNVSPGRPRPQLLDGAGQRGRHQQLVRLRPNGTSRSSTASASGGRDAGRDQYLGASASRSRCSGAGKRPAPRLAVSSRLATVQPAALDVVATHFWRRADPRAPRAAKTRDYCRFRGPGSETKSLARSLLPFGARGEKMRRYYRRRGHQPSATRRPVAEPSASRSNLVDVSFLPGDGTLVVAEEALAAEELWRSAVARGRPLGQGALRGERARGRRCTGRSNEGPTSDRAQGWMRTSRSWAL